MVMSIDMIIYQLEGAGIFNFLLPFLLVFALVYGILTATNMIGHNKGVSVVIALVVGLMSIRLGFMQAFFAEMFPRLGIGLSILLALMILVGLFIPNDERRYWMWGFGAIGAVILIIIMVQSFDVLGLIGMGGGYWSDYVGYIIGAVLLIGVIIAVATSGSKREEKEKKDAEFKIWRKEE